MRLNRRTRIVLGAMPFNLVGIALSVWGLSLSSGWVTFYGVASMATGVAWLFSNHARVLVSGIGIAQVPGGSDEFVDPDDLLERDWQLLEKQLKSFLIQNYKSNLITVEKDQSKAIRLRDEIFAVVPFVVHDDKMEKLSLYCVFRKSGLGWAVERVVTGDSIDNGLASVHNA